MPINSYLFINCWIIFVKACCFQSIIVGKSDIYFIPEMGPISSTTSSGVVGDLLLGPSQGTRSWRKSRSFQDHSARDSSFQHNCKVLSKMVAGSPALVLEHVLWPCMSIYASKYSRLSLSRNRKDPQNQLEISVLRHIRFVVLRKKQFEQPNFINDYVI